MKKKKSSGRSKKKEMAVQLSQIPSERKQKIVNERRKIRKRIRLGMRGCVVDRRLDTALDCLINDYVMKEIFEN